MNAKDWHDEALKTVEKTVKEYWNNCRDLIAGNVNQQYSCSNHNSSHPLKSEYDHHHCQLLEKMAIQVNTSRWKEELCCYLTEIPSDVSKETNIIVWWAVHVSFNFISHCKEYPTLSHIARDVCAIPAMSVPCKCLFLNSAEIATDHQSHLGEEKFKQLQVLKYSWQKQIVDTTHVNSFSYEEVYLGKFQQLLQRDEELLEWDNGEEIVNL
ncbi:hypothetical protein SCLCIDRAFT_129691 [Scleroderma citrinum Foug A]|uniref:HAT C-terminal dimerisation domain-containing protein n=1 Tax=Scleroderma citrinum Foug A TaxID=1036808 RepID=A0A0C3DND4_9AGAM|nr:hypothetical protein SCLCIDRAFT_129691 [Scleroderma citrinum Foug A]